MAGVDLTPRQSRKAYGGEGGVYCEWSPADLPMLGVANIGAAKLSLAAGGLSLPSYSDSAKVAYVLQGTGTCGIVLPEATKEKVVAVKEGDALALPFGVVTWWHNAPDASTELLVLFLGDTSKGHKPGQFTNFQLTGATGIFTGFPTEFVGRAWDLAEPDAAKLVSSQPGSALVKLPAGGGPSLPAPSPQDREGVALNCQEAPLDVDIPGGGRVVVLNTKNLPLVKDVGLGADLVRIDGHVHRPRQRARAGGGARRGARARGPRRGGRPLHRAKVLRRVQDRRREGAGVVLHHHHAGSSVQPSGGEDLCMEGHLAPGAAGGLQHHPRDGAALQVQAPRLGDLLRAATQQVRRRRTKPRRRSSSLA